MISQKLQQDVQEILQDLEEVLAVYMEAQQRIGKERREIINQFAKQLESLEVRGMQERIQQKTYGGH